MSIAHPTHERSGYVVRAMVRPTDTYRRGPGELQRQSFYFIDGDNESFIFACNSRDENGDSLDDLLTSIAKTLKLAADK